MKEHKHDNGITVLEYEKGDLMYDLTDSSNHIESISTGRIDHDVYMGNKHQFLIGITNDMHEVRAHRDFDISGSDGMGSYLLGKIAGGIETKIEIYNYYINPKGKDIEICNVYIDELKDTVDIICEMNEEEKLIPVMGLNYFLF